jgi:(2Fe-2S) ferredoxin
MGKSATVFQFQLEGEFAGFVGESGSKSKYLRLAVAEQELRIKLAKDLRSVLPGELLPGDRVCVLGEKKFKGDLGKLTLKAYQVERLSCTLENCSPNNLPCPQKGKILLCQKSGCLKRGGKHLYQALEQALVQLGLREFVTIEGTGCQKRCKKAPNMVLMPGKVKCASIPPQAIPALIEQHYCSQSVN